jgi:hypothetical protein
MRQTTFATIVFSLTLIATTVSSVQPSAPPLLKQERIGAPAINLTAAELATLGDPLFELVFRENAAATALSQIEPLIQPDAQKRHTFVVDENIVDPRRRQQRRAVLTFTGSNRGIVLDSNVMLSVTFSSEDFPDEPSFIEAWGWDNQRSRYNYYKLDREGTPDQRRTWKFRNTSADADLLSPGDRAGTCLRCHINGAPVMKELSFPWNNWHSPAASSNTTYLTAASPAGVRWPVTANPHLAAALSGAEDLEVGGVLPAITQFNTRRLNAQLTRSDVDGNIALTNGRATVVGARRLLRPLFLTTEVNLISAKQRSGLHPLPAISTTGPAQDVLVPPSFFLNANILAGGTPAQYKGLGLVNALQLGQVARLSPAEYTKLVVESRLQLAGKEPGDAEFAWFGPEPSHVDNDFIDRLLRRGVITPAFAASVLGVDLETPVFSEKRASLLHFIPDSFTFPMPATPLASDDLRSTVMRQVAATNPAPGSPEQEFLDNLRDADPVARLRTRIDAYAARIKAALQQPSTRPTELTRLFQALNDRRIRMLQDAFLGVLDETGDRLLPLPPLSRPPITGSGGQVIR